MATTEPHSTRAVPAHLDKPLKPGRLGFLIWNGYPGVPMELNRTWAEIVEVHRSRCTVSVPSWGGIKRKVRFDQIYYCKDKD